MRGLRGGLAGGLTGMLLAGLILLAGCTTKEDIEYGIRVESVTVSLKRVDLPIRGRITLVATVLPAEAENQNVTWSTSNPAIVSVDERGRIRGEAAGQATVTVTTEDGDKSASCDVFVEGDELIAFSIAEFPDFPTSLRVPFGKDFDNVRVDISGFEWEVIASIRAGVTRDNSVTLSLPASLPTLDRPDAQLSKVGRENSSDYAGFWPAPEISDLGAKVAGLRDIVAFRGDERVGRISLTDGNGNFGYFHYADRPFTLGGRTASFVYQASFSAGWNLYVNQAGTNTTPSVCTTEIPDGLGWVFE